MCNKEEAFSLSDMAAIYARIKRHALDGPTPHDYSIAPKDPIAAKIMREIGVSPEARRRAHAKLMAFISGRQ